MFCKNPCDFVDHVYFSILSIKRRHQGKCLQFDTLYVPTNFDWLTDASVIITLTEGLFLLPKDIEGKVQQRNRPINNNEC